MTGIIGRALLRVWILTAALLAGAATAPHGDPVLSLASAGGDAWIFEKLIEGRVSAGRCTSVAIEASTGTVEALLEGTRFVAKVPLRSGVNTVQAVCRRGGDPVAHSPAAEWRVRLAERPKAWIRTRVGEASIAMDTGGTERSDARPARLVRYEWRARAGNPAALRVVGRSAALDRQPVLSERLDLEPPAADGEYYVTLRAVDALGRSDEGTTVFRVRNGRPAAVDLAREHPLWVDDAVIYGVAPFFFGPGGFAAVRERLDAIVALGATAIWLSPVTAAAAGDFGYAVTDHFRLRPTFGSEREFRALVDAAHARGLRVLMDFVPNHLSDEHPYYLDTERRGAASPYFGWFERDAATGEPTHYFDWENLKNLEYDSREVQSYVIAAFAHWVREYGIDGFRVDASWAVGGRAPEFWPRWRAELKRIDPDLFLLAEASAREPYHVANGFDAAYDWTGTLGEWAWRAAFGAGGADADVGQLRAALTNDGAGYPDDTLILRFLNNNDTGARFVTRHGVARTRVAAVMLLTLPGLPLIYNGDEVGAAFEPYAEGPPIAWRDPYALTPHYRRLARLRHAHPALRTRGLEIIASDREEVLAYRRPGTDAAQDVLVVLNFSGRAVRARFAPTASLAGIFATGSVANLLTEERLKLAPSAPAVSLKPYEGLILRRATGDR